MVSGIMGEFFDWSFPVLFFLVCATHLFIPRVSTLSSRHFERLIQRHPTCERVSGMCVSYLSS